MTVSYPTSTVYRWATTLANRVAATVSEKASGFLGGNPVPPLSTNDLHGVETDWLDWLSKAMHSSQQVLIIPSGLGNFITPGTVTFLGASGAVTITAVSAPAIAVAHQSPVMVGGKITTVQAYIGAVTATTGAAEVSVQLRTPSGVAIWVDSAITTTGAKTLPLSVGSTTLPNDGATVDVDGPCWLTVTITTPTTNGDSVRLDYVTFDMD